MERFAELTALTDESTMTAQFRKIAERFCTDWVIEKDRNRFEILESEFLCNFTNGIHQDPFIDESPLQFKMGRWYISDGGIDITFGTDAYSAAAFIRSVKNLTTGEVIMGPNRVFKVLFQDAGHIQNGGIPIRFLERQDPVKIDICAVPRVSLNIEYSSSNLENRMAFAFKPYRFVRHDMDDFSEKYLANLYLDKVEGKDIGFNREGKIYDKYLNHFDKGVNATHIDQVWNISSRSLRMATLLGYMYKRHPELVI